MSERLSFDVLRDGVVDAPAFQRACQRYAHGNGSSEAIAMAVLTAIDFGDLYLDALRYRFLRASVVDGGDHLDQSIDASMEMQIPEGHDGL